MLEELRAISPQYELPGNVKVEKQTVENVIKEKTVSWEKRVLMRNLDGMLKSDTPEIKHAAEIFIAGITEQDGLKIDIDRDSGSSCYVVVDYDHQGNKEIKMVFGKGFFEGKMPHQFKFVHEVKHYEDVMNGLDFRKSEDKVLSETHALAAELATYVQGVQRFPNATIAEYEAILDLSRRHNKTITEVVETFGRVHAENPDFRFANIMQDTKLILGLL